ncbi:MAG: 50S ribosomal protein L7/L12 [bacterium]|nr:50S ribosomal protein L7/L12 [bacterium]
MSEETTVTKEKIELTPTAQKVVESVESMTVLELSHLVKALEDKFGVVAAAPMAMAAAPGAAGADDADAGDSTVSVVLANAGDKKIQVLKVVREITGLGLKEAKELVDAAPKEIKGGVAKEEAEVIKKQLEEQGATVEFK